MNFNSFKCLLGAASVITAAPSAFAQQPIPPAAPAPQVVTRIYQIKYATPLELAKIVGELIPSVKVVLGPQPKFVRDTPAGEALGVEATVAQAIAAKVQEPPSVNVSDQFVRFLVLRGAEKDVRDALDTLAQIDLPAPQVLIEAKIVDMSDEAAAQIGVTWDFAPSGTTANFSLDRPASPDEGKKWPQVVFGRLTRDVIKFNAALDAAVQNNKAKVLASPRLMVLYNQRARIFVGDEVTYLLGTASSINGQTLQTGRVNVGVELNVVATGNSDGTINLKVNPEIGGLIQLETLNNGISLPRISRRTVTTAVRIRDGETIVIGGLKSSNETRSTRKVPILGDIPILGQLFRHDTRSRVKSEVVIVLRASVVKDAPAAESAASPEVVIPPKS